MITYIPINESNFMLTHSRDESILRPIATPPVKREINGVQHMFPVDPQGRGTWVGISENGRVAALFNGGSKPYTPDPPYKHSRGKIITEFFKYPSFDEFYTDFNTENLEPFTLLVLENGRFYEMRKDADRLTLDERNPLKPHIFLSVPLYPRETEENRRLELFNLYYDKGFISKKDVLNFHEKYRFETSPDETFDTGPHILKTVSTTCITKTPATVAIDYYDKVNDIRIDNRLDINQTETQHISR